MRFTLAAISLLVCSSLLSQQIDTIVNLDKVVITANSGDKVEVEKIIGLPTNSTLLQKSSNLFIRNYGPSFISTLSNKGGNANQTSVSWNNIPINHPMHGVTDLSIINPLMMTSVKLGNQTDALQSLAGELKYKSDFNNNGVTIFNHIGSFGNRSHSLKFDKSFSKIDISGNLLRHSSINNFPYQINGIEFLTEHAKFKQNSVMLNIRIHLLEGLSLKLSTWFNDSFRNIPSTTVQNKNLSKQADKSFRNAINLRYAQNDWQFDSDIGLTCEEILYNDPVINLNAPSNTNSLFFKVAVHKIIKQTRISILSNVLSSNSIASAYTKKQRNTISSIRAKAKFRVRKSTFAFTSGITNGNEEKIYFPWDFNFKYSINSVLLVKGLVSSKVRFPTSNDLFWTPGGNPDLKPESSLSQELRLEYVTLSKKAKLGFYHRMTDNWILWALTPGNNFYNVQNLAQVKSYGIEAEIERSFKVSKELKFKSCLLGHVLKSENRKKIILPNIEIGDQLFYIPTHKFISKVLCQFRNAELSLAWQSISATKGLSKDLSGYNLFDMTLSYSFEKSFLNTNISIACNNLFNENYRVIEYRPMPGRNYNFTITLNIK